MQLDSFLRATAASRGASIRELQRTQVPKLTVLVSAEFRFVTVTTSFAVSHAQVPINAQFVRTLVRSRGAREGHVQNLAIPVDGTESIQQQAGVRRNEGLAASLVIIYFISNFVNIVNGDVTGDVTKKQLATASFCIFLFSLLFSRKSREPAFKK